MAIATYKPYETGELIDVPYEHGEGFRKISIGNCCVSYQLKTKTFSFYATSDDEWPLKSAENFSRIMDYILVTYGS